MTRPGVIKVSQTSRPASDIFKAPVDKLSKTSASKRKASTPSRVIPVAAEAVASFADEDDEAGAQTAEESEVDEPESAGPEEPAGEVQPKKKRRAHPGTKALREIRQLQTSVKPAIPRAIIYEIVKSTAVELGYQTMRFTKGAIDVLREAAEDECVFHMCESMNLAARQQSRSLLFRHFDSVRRCVVASKMRYGGFTQSNKL